MLAYELNKSWNIASVNSMGYHTPQVVMKVNQQLEHNLCLFYRKENYALPVVMICRQQLEHVSVGSFEKHASPVVMRVEEHLDLCLC